MVNDKRDTCVQFSVGGTKMKRIGYKHTVAASFTAFVVQAVVNNFAPLLFLTFQAQYGIELSKITVLITANFFIQIFVDLTAVLFVDRIGYRASTVLAHAMCATGLIFMTILPEILPSAFAGLLVSVFCYAVGAGLLDITINPIVNSCPSTNSNQLLCLLHSFYCWGSVAAVGISTLFFALFSTDNWKIMSLIWAILPIVNAVMFARVPIAPVVGEDEEKLSIKDMLKTKAFWIFMVLILCAGSSEQAVSQWASTFAEKALGLTKTVGDLAGPMLFSILMGVSRFMYGKFGNRINLDSMMLLSGCVCTASYFLISLTSSPILGLVGVAVCGLSAGILWPGTIGKMSSALHGGGLLEVIVSPIVEACPTDNKEKMMSLLHSFYCWGSVAVVGISTLYFSIFTTANWKYLALIWAVVPIVNALNFIRVPIAPLIEEGEKGLSFKQLLGNRMFWIFMLLILCSGASEQAVSQWASTFAEKGLGVSKTVGDLAGPMLFSVLMGVSRVIYGKFGDKIDLDGMMIFSGALCMASYLLIALSSSAVLGLVGVAMCGFSVGIMWPGTFSKASAGIKGGGTAMFALLALGGDLGCSSGPTFAGMMASAFGDDLKKGILCAIFFPALLTVLTIFTKRRKAKN